MRVFVLLFNARTENEGIHTVQVGGRNKILMFESEDDATRYALLLEAQDFPEATLETIDSEEIEEFCRGADYDWELIQDGILAIPPETNIAEPDWNLEGKSQTKSAEEIAEEMSQAELERLRRQFEGLL